MVLEKNQRHHTSGEVCYKSYSTLHVHWEVGDESKNKIGLDAINGMIENHSLFAHILNHVHGKDIYFPNQNFQWRPYYMDQHAWYRAWELELLVVYAGEWENYMTNVWNAGIPLSEQEDHMSRGGILKKGHSMVKDIYISLPKKVREHFFLNIFRSYGSGIFLPNKIKCFSWLSIMTVYWHGKTFNDEDILGLGYIPCAWGDRKT